MSQLAPRPSRAPHSSGVASGFAWVLLASCALLALLPPMARAQNPIVLENQQPGTSDWRLSGRIADDANGQIQGFAADTSVDAGSSLTIYVTVNPSGADFSYSIDVYRMGWYDGDRGRLMASFAGLTGVTQPTCTTIVGPTTPGGVNGTTCDGWSPSFTLPVPVSWTTGIYLAKLTNADGYQSYVMFAVRDDDRLFADFFYQQAVLTYHAYNRYPNGGVSFYSGGSGPLWDNTVSLDRPYGSDLFVHNNHGLTGSGGDGSGGFFVFDFPMIGWLEREGYDVLYGTNVDAHRDPERLCRVGGILSVGHDEYWSGAMGTNVKTARDTGTHLVFFSGNSVYGTVELSASTLGPERVMRGLTRVAGVGPVTGADPDVARRQELIGLGTTTCCGRAPSIHYNPPWVVAEPSHWVFEGTGFQAGDAVAGFNGPESDEFNPLFPPPAGSEFTLIAESDYGDGAGGDPRVVIEPYGGVAVGHSAVFRAPSGAWVFNAAAMDWPWSVDVPYETTLAYDPALGVGDPADQGFEPTTTGAATSSVALDGGQLALRVDGVGGGRFWSRSPIPAQTQGATEGWRLTAELRIESGAQNLLFYSGGGRRRTDVRFTRDASGNLLGDFRHLPAPVTLVTNDPVGAYHSHVLEYDPATDTVAYTLDGAPVAAVPDFDPGATGATTPLLQFGNASTGTDGVMWVRRFEFEILSPLTPDPRMAILNRNVLDRLRLRPARYDATTGDGTPVGQGWADGTTLAGSGSLVVDAGSPAWLADGVGGGALWTVGVSAEAHQKYAATGWVLEAELRVESGEWITFSYADGALRYLVRFGLDAGGDLVAILDGAGGAPIPLASGPAATVHHVHRIRFDPTTQLATYLFDGQPFGTWSGAASSQDGLLFGQGSSAIDGRGYFRRISISAAPLAVPLGGWTIPLLVGALGIALGTRAVSSTRRPHP